MSLRTPEKERKANFERRAKAKEQRRLREEKKLQLALRLEREDIENRIMLEELDKTIKQPPKKVKRRAKPDKNCGIYRLYNIETGKSYIGQSKNITSRTSNHFYNLKKNQHCCPALQKDYNIYGRKKFKVERLCSCPPEYLDSLERKYHLIFANRKTKLYSDVYVLTQVPFCLKEQVDLLIEEYNKQHR